MMDQLFTWTGDWEHLDTWRFLFRNVTLRVPIGSFPAGSKPLQVTIDFRDGRLWITNDVTHTEEFDLTLLLTPASK
jgi:hypothetical protein